MDNSVIVAYKNAIAVDNSAVWEARLKKLMTGVKKQSVDELKETHKKLGYLLKDAGDKRMEVQRAIKDHEIGKYAFAKTQIEKDIEKAQKDVKKLQADKKDSPEIKALKHDKQEWCCYIKCDLMTINKLAGELAERGIPFENRGPVIIEEGK